MISNVSAAVLSLALCVTAGAQEATDNPEQVSQEPKGPSWLDPGASFRTIAAGLDQSHLLPPGGSESPAGLSQSLLRLTLAAEPTRSVKLEAHTVFQYSFSSFGSGAGFGGSPDAARRFQALRMSWKLTASNSAFALAEIDRLSAKWSLSRADITVGRQAINFSKAYFWNPLDVFLPFDPKAFDRDYKPGVDALRVDVSIGDYSGLNFVAALGPTLTVDATTLNVARSGRFFDASIEGSALIARGFTTLGGFDFAIQGGKTYGAYQFGLGIAGDVGGFGARAEASYSFGSKGQVLSLPDALGLPRDALLMTDHARLVVGCDRRWESSLYVALEYAYDGAADERDPLLARARFAAGEVVGLGRHMAGVVASYDLLPVLVGRMTSMVSISDRSMLLGPSLTYSIADEAELLVGAMWGFGKRPDFSGVIPVFQSEFGSYPNVVYGELKVYF